MPVQKADAGAVTSVSPARWHADWVATFGPRSDVSATAQAWHGADRSLVLHDGTGSDAQVDASHDLVVIFSGVLTNAAELSPRAELEDAARIVAARFRAKGEAAFEELRGPFAVLAWERGSDRLVVARDHVGIEPIFYAQHGEHWHFSPSPDRLVERPGISSEMDAVAFAEWLCGWFPAVEDTGYREVKRVPPATVLTVERAEARARRYWDLWPDGPHEIDWLEEPNLDQFGPLLKRAVDRAMRPGPSAIFLSGGLDSIAVAATATALARESRRSVPLALSLVFPGTASEEPVQVGVARKLGLEHALVGFEEAAGPQGLLAGALDVSAGWPQPMWNIWSPAYRRLAERGGVTRCRVLMTGRGGDEWLTISPYLLADQVRRGDLVGAWRLIAMRRRSNGLSGAKNIARLLWLTAGRSLASATLDVVAPSVWHARRRRRLLGERPRWVAPDPAIRRAMAGRIERWMEPARPRHGFYAREGKTALRHPAVTHDMEETQEFGRRLGVRVLHPFWDIDLVSMLHRVPPRLLMQDGRSKSLLRRRLAADIPGLGLETRGKGTAAHVFQNVMEQEAPPIIRKSGGPMTLARLGVVDQGSVDYANSTVGAWGGPGRLWAVLNLETWARHRS